jgi:hypothetical protein
MSTIWWRSGMMECWNIGRVDTRSEKNTSVVILSLNPSFQYSIIPMFQLGKALEFLYNRQLTKIVPTKVRKLQLRFQREWSTGYL